MKDSEQVEPFFSLRHGVRASNLALPLHGPDIQREHPLAFMPPTPPPSDQDFVALQHPSLKGRAFPLFADFDPLRLPWEAASLKKPLPPGIALAKRSRSRLVLATTHAGVAVHVKRAASRSWARKFSARLTGPKTLREFRAAITMRDLGVIVPEPLHYGAAGAFLSFLTTRTFPPAWMPLASRLRDGGLDEHLLHDVAKFTRVLHELPACHGDYRSDHIWLTDAPATAPLLERFALIDLDGSTAGESVSTRAREKAWFELCLSLLRRDIAYSAFAAMLGVYEGRQPIGLSAATIYRTAREHHASTAGDD